MEEERRLWKNLKQIVSGESPESKEEVQEAVEHVVEECGSQGYLEENEVRMIKNVLQYSGKNARYIITRFPVYEENIDDIIGTIHLRDAMKYYLNKELRPVKVKELKDCLREVSFIPETKGLSRLFKQMNTEKNHLFIVLDEYGQTAGIVAMEDIIEEIVGNIFDEYDEEETLYFRQENGTYLVKGKVALDDLEEILGIEIEDEENETLNGFLISKLERIPAEHETCEVQYDVYCFRILRVDNNMIELVEVEKIED